uniref:Uncharacterized protein n=1 Tax=Setaria italica TaxID=4555 RepID=K3ZB93_SETIT
MKPSEFRQQNHHLILQICYHVLYLVRNTKGWLNKGRNIEQEKIKNTQCGLYMCIQKEKKRENASPLHHVFQILDCSHVVCRERNRPQ